MLHDLHEITTYQLRTGGARLAETYTACKLIFGERGKLFDDWKGSFSFPLTVEVEGCPFKPMYLLNVVNIRRGVDYRLEQIVAVDDERLKTRYVRYACEHQNPDFQTSDLTELVFRLIGFFEGFLQGFEETCGRTEPFLLSVPSDLILFGFSPTEKFFNRDLDNRQEYEAVQEALSLDLSRPGFFKNRNR